MKRMSRTKTILMLAMVVLILAGAVGGTLAYITTKTSDLTNTFTPSKVTCQVVEDFQNGGTTKNNVKIKNTGDTSAYIRAVVVGNWCDAAGKIVAPWNDNINYNTTDWTKVDGYYYYKEAVAKEGLTNNLFNSYTPGNAPVDGAHLELTIVCQAIQSEGLGSEVNNAQSAFAYVARTNPGSVNQ